MARRSTKISTEGKPWARYLRLSKAEAQEVKGLTKEQAAGADQPQARRPAGRAQWLARRQGSAVRRSPRLPSHGRLARRRQAGPRHGARRSDDRPDRDTGPAVRPSRHSHRRVRHPRPRRGRPAPSRPAPARGRPGVGASPPRSAAKAHSPRVVVHLPRAVYPPSPPKRTQMPMSGRQMAPWRTFVMGLRIKQDWR